MCAFGPKSLTYSGNTLSGAAPRSGRIVGRRDDGFHVYLRALSKNRTGIRIKATSLANAPVSISRLRWTRTLTNVNKDIFVEKIDLVICSK